MNPSDEPRPTNEPTPAPTPGEPVPPSTPDTESAPETSPPVTPAPESPTPAGAPLVQPTPVPEAAPAASEPPKSRARKGLVVLLILVVLIAAGVTAYFIWASMQPVPAETPTTNTASQESSNDTVDTSDEVTAEAAAINEELDQLDSSEFDDSTLDNSELSQ